MKKNALIFALAAGLAISAHAQNKSILIKPIQGEKTMDVQKTMNIYGSCGEAIIAILGVNSNSFDGSSTFTVDPSGIPEVLVRSSGKEHSFGWALSDFNSIKCSASKKGDRLVIGSNCSGSSCGDMQNYHVIDTKSGAVFPSKGSQVLCNNVCLKEALQ